MTFQALQTISQIAVALGVTLSAIGGFGAYYYGKKIDKEEEKERPIVDLCNRGITVTQLNDTTVFFDIPYCSGKNANAYNVKLQTSIILKTTNSLKVIAPTDETFPENIILTYETGKSISYKLSPFTRAFIYQTYIYVKGSFTNEDESRIFQISDLFKYSTISNNWVRLIGKENEEVRNFLKN
jgi:hypothetical protein